MDSSKSAPGSGSKTFGTGKIEGQEKGDGSGYLLNEDISEPSTNVTDMSDSEAQGPMVQDVFQGTSRRGPGRPRKESNAPVKKLGHRQRGKKVQDSPQLTESLPELAAGEACEPPVLMEVVSDNKDVVEGEMMKSEAVFATLPGSSSPRVPSSLTPKHDFDVSFTDTGDSSSRTSLTVSLEKMVSEDSVASEGTSSSGTIEKVCAFCNRGEKSLLGQGELTHYEPTAGFNPFKKQLSRSKRTPQDPDDAAGKKAAQHLTWRRTRGTSKVPSGEKGRTIGGQSQMLPTDSHSRPTTVDELSLVGYSEDTDLSQVFEKTGHIWAHHCCAAWSEGVIQSEDFSLHNVDKAVFSGLTQKCSYCCHYGATIKCRDSRCSKKYHYPCASGGGCFQDIKTLSLLCPDHTDQAVAIANQEANCVVCDTPGSILDQLFCTSCGQHYHGNCLDPTVEVNPVVRAGWQCPECKICQTCRQPGDDNKMLVCDTCDKGYHTFCLQPAMTTIPKNGWKCKNCRICTDCGSRTPGSGNSSRWHLNYSVCDSCYQQRNKGQCCPLCGKAYRQFTQNKMVPCCLCKRYVHAECDESLDLSKIDHEDYVCLACKNRDSAGFEVGSQTDSLSSVVDENSLQDIENFRIFKGLKEGDLGPNHESGFDGDDLMQHSQDVMMADDSIPCSELDLNPLGKAVQRLDTPSTVVQSNSMSELNNGSDVSLAGDSKPALAGGVGGAVPRPSGPGMGKPMFSEQYEKKMTASRKNRSVGIGKKKRITSHPATSGKRGPKPKLKQLSSSQGGNSTDQGSKDDDHSSTVVLCSSKDQFTLKQDMCLSCGSFGKGEEGKLIACVQCGQCYHPYCVNLKVSDAMLQKGWRCLDCTVCEGCGKPHDESRLILCDECDISYHIYCLDPPLESVPQGSWKCKWCIVCVTCGANTPGVGCQWRDNYSQCGPCASLETCPFCNVVYVEGDLIIQCTHCSRWVHALCDGLKNEDDTEAALNFGYNCMLCRPKTGAPGPLPPPPPPVKAELIPSGLSMPRPNVLPTTLQVQTTTPKEPEPPKVPKTFFLDGVCLSEAGINSITNQSLKIAEKKRPRWKRPLQSMHPALVPMLSISSEKSEEDADNDAKSLAVDPLDGDECKSEVPHDEWDMTSPTYDKPMESGPGLSIGMEKKKKPRTRIGMGIGGFLPRHRTRGGGLVRSRIGSALPKPLGSGDAFGLQAAGTSGVDVNREDEDCRLDAESKKPKRRTRKIVKKSQLEDSYPTYLQEAFFGRVLLDKSKSSQTEDFELMSEDDKEDVGRMSSLVGSKDLQRSKDPFEFSDSPPPAAESITGGYKGPNDPPWMMQQPQMQQQQQHRSQLQQQDEPPQQQMQLPQPTVVSSASTSLSTSRIELSTPQNDDESDKEQNIEDALDVLPEEPLEVEDLIGACWADLTAQPEHSPMLDELTQIDNETLEDFLKNELANEQHADTSPTSHGNTGFSLASIPGTSLQNTNPSGFLTKDSLQTQRDDIFVRQNTPSSSISPFSPTLGTDDFPGLEFPDPPPAWGGPQFNPRQPSLSSSQMMPSTGADDVEAGETLSYNQRNVKKWRKDEPLGELATISPVLYANLCHPDLKTRFPEWTERAKHISKLWRKVPSDQRTFFLAKAKDNRAASRLQKQQKMTQEAKRKIKDSPSAAVGSGIGIGPIARLPLTAMPQTSDVTSQDQPVVDPSNQNVLQSLKQTTASVADDQGQSEPDPYPFLRHPSSAQSSPGASFPVQHPSAVFKQPHPPSQSYDHCGPQTPGTPRQTDMFMPHHPLHQMPGATQDPYIRPPHTPSAPPSDLSPSHFGRLPGSNRPSPVGAHPSTPGGFKPSPTAEEYGPRMFPPSFPSPSSRLPDQFGFCDPLLRGGPERFPVPGAVPPHPGDQFPGQTSEISQSLDADLQTPKTPKHSDGHKQGPPMLQRSVSDPFGQPMVPRVDPYSHAPMTPRPTSDSYSHGPMTPRSNMGEAYGQPPSTPKPGMVDHYGQPPMTPKPVMTDPYAMAASRTNPDPYSQPPMTPRPVSDPYSQPPMTPRPNTDVFGQPSMSSRPNIDPYSQPPMTPRPSAESFGQPVGTPRSNESYGQPGLMQRGNINPYAQPPMTPRPTADPYGQPPMTPRPNPEPYGHGMAPRPQLDPYNQATPMSRPGAAGGEQFGNPQMAGPPQMTGRPVVSDAYSHQPMTPRAGVADSFGLTSSLTPHKSAVPDPYAHPPMTPRPLGHEGYGGMPPPRPAFSDSYLGPRASRPGPPGASGAADIYSQPPATPQMMARVMPMDDYPVGGSSAGPAPNVASQDPFLASAAQRAVTSEPYKQPPPGVDQYNPQMQQHQQQQQQPGQGVPRPPPESPGDVPKGVRPSFVPDDGDPTGSSMLEGDQQKQDTPRHHLRELLAKQSKQRQKQKKQEESNRMQQQQDQSGAVGSSASLRHWPEDGAGMPFPNAPGRGQYEGHHQPVGPEMVTNPNVGIRGPLDMDRWPKESMMRMPHSAQMRPRSDVEQFGIRGTPEEVMAQQRFSLSMRGNIRPPLGPNIPYTSMPYQQQQQQQAQQRQPLQPQHLPPQQDLFALQHHQAAFKGQSLERFRRSASVSGETPAGQKPQPPMMSPHRPPGALPGPEGVSFGYQPGRMPYHGSVLPLSRMPGGNPYDAMLRGQAVPRMGNLPQHLMRPWPPHPHNLPMESSYGMMQPGGMPGMRPMYSDPTGAATSGQLQHPQMGPGSPGIPNQSLGPPMHQSMMPPSQQPGLPLGPGQPQDSDKSADQFDDLLGSADDGFNLLEYADTDLDSALTELHDKSMFDEHLGIMSKNITTSKEMAQSVGGVLMTQAPLESEPKTRLAESVADTSGAVALADSGQTLSSAKAENPGLFLKPDQPEAVSGAKVPESSLNMEKPAEASAAASAATGTEFLPTKPAPDLTSNFQAKFIEYSKRQPADAVVCPDGGVKASDAAKEKSDASTAESTGGKQVKSEDTAGDDKSLTLPMQVDGCVDFSSSEEEMDDDREGLAASTVDYLPNVSAMQHRVDLELGMDVEEPELVRIWDTFSPFAQVDGAADDKEEVKKETGSSLPSKDAEDGGSGVSTSGDAASAAAPVAVSQNEDPQVPEPKDDSESVLSDPLPSNNGGAMDSGPGESEPVVEPDKSENMTEPAIVDEPVDPSVSKKSPGVNQLSAPEPVVPDVATATTGSDVVPPVTAAPSENAEAPASVAENNAGEITTADSNVANQILPAVGQASRIVSQEMSVPQQNSGYILPHQMMAGMMPRSFPPQQLTPGGPDHRLRGLVSTHQLQQLFSGDMIQQQQYVYHQQPPGHPYPVPTDPAIRGLLSFSGPPSGPPPPYPSQQMPMNPMQIQRLRQQQQYLRQMNPRVGISYQNFPGHDSLGYVGGYPAGGQLPHPTMHQSRSPHPAQSPHNLQSPHGLQSPHNLQSPHGLQSPAGLGTGGHQEPVAPPAPDASLPNAAMQHGMSPRPSQSPVAWPGPASGQSPLGGGPAGQQPIPSPRTVAASPHLPSPHQRSRSGTPQVMSPANAQQMSKPGTPQAGAGVSLNNMQQQGTPTGHGSAPATPSASVSQASPFSSSVAMATGAIPTPNRQVEGISSAGHPEGLTDQAPTSLPTDPQLLGTTANSTLTPALQPSQVGAETQQPGVTVSSAPLAFPCPETGTAQEQNKASTTTPMGAMSSDPGALQAPMPASGAVMYIPRMGSFLPRDGPGRFAQVPFQRPFSQPGYPGGMKIMHHMIQPGVGQMGTRPDVSLVQTMTTTAQSAIGALLNQQRQINPALGPNVGLMQHGPRPGLYGPRIADARYQLMQVPAGQMQRPYLPGAQQQSQMLHHTMIGNMPGTPMTPGIHSTQPSMMPSVPLLSPGNRPGISGQAVPIDASQASGIAQSHQQETLMGPRGMAFPPQPFPIGPRGLGVGDPQQQAFAGLHVKHLQQSAIMGLIPQHGPSSRPRRIDEQPLLLEDLLEQEKREQQRQAEQQSQQSQAGQDLPHLTSSSITAGALAGTSSGAMVSTASTTSSAPDSSAILTDADLDKLCVPVDVMLEDFHSSLAVAEAFPGQAHLQHQQIEQTLQQTSDHSWMGLASTPAHLFSPRQVTPQLGPRMAPFMGPLPPAAVGGASGILGPPVIGSPMAYSMMPVAMQPAPLRPPDPPVECLTEEDQQSKLKYEEWLVQYEIWITAQIHMLEQQIVKYRKTKKALNAKLRSAKKNSSSLSEADQQTLQTTTNEQGSLQKQLDLLRKQLRTHKNLVAEYRSKQPESLPGPWPVPGGHLDVVMPFGTQPMVPSRQSPSASSSVPVPAGAPPRLPVPRMPGATPPARLPPEVRQEYEAYVQNRIRMRQAHPPRAVIVQGDENNPFSESYQQREQLEKFRQQQEQQRFQMQAEQQRPLPTDEQGCLDTAGGHAYGDQGQLMHPKPFSHFPPDSLSRLPGPPPPQPPPRFPGPPLNVNFPADLPVRMFSPASGSESNLSAVPSGHSSPGLSPAPGTVLPGPFSPQVKSEHPLRKTAASASLQQMPQGLSTPQHPTGLYTCPKTEPLLTSNIATHSSPSVAIGALSSDHQQQQHQQLNIQSHLPFNQSPTNSHFSQQSQPPALVSSLASVTPQRSATHVAMTSIQPMASSLDPSLMGLPDAMDGVQTSAPVLAEKPKKRRQRRKKADPAAVEDADSGCVRADLDLNPYFMMASMPPELSLGSPSGAGNIGIPRYGMRADCPPRFAIPIGDAGKVVPPGMDLQHQRMVSPPGGPLLYQRLPVAAGMVAGRPDLQGLAHGVPSQQQQLRGVAPEQVGREPVHLASGGIAASLHPSEYGSQASMTYGATGDSNQAKPVASQPAPATRLVGSNGGDLQLANQQLPIGSSFGNSTGNHAEIKEDLDGKPGSQNALIKRLLKPSVVADQTSSLSRMSEDEENIQLTPEQQRQLELIERMPYMIEKSDQDDLELKSVEDKEKILELKRQEFERRRKMTDLPPKGTKQKQRPKAAKQESNDGEQRIVKKRKKSTGISAAVDPAMAMVQQQQSQPLQPGKGIDKVDYGAVIEQLMQQLHQLPPITLQEPEVKINYAVWPMLGTSLFSDGSSGTTELQGNYGSVFLDAFMDYYNRPPFLSHSTLAPVSGRSSKSGTGGAVGRHSPCAATEFIPGHHHPLGADGLGPFEGTSAADMESRLHARLSVSDASVAPTKANSGSSSMSLVSSILNEQQSRGGVAERIKLPSPPLIEPRLGALSRNESPLTVISSSSPELGLDENSSSAGCKFPGLRLISAEKRQETCESPVIPIICPLPLKAVGRYGGGITYTEKTPDKELGTVKINKDKDSLGFKGLKTFLPSKQSEEQNQVSVKLTLSPGAAENITGVIAAIADLLLIAVPPSLVISRSPSPTSDSHRSNFMSRAKLKEEAVNIQSLMKSKQKLCHSCESIVLGSGIRKKKTELPCRSDLQNDLGELDEVIFCDSNCLTQYEMICKNLAMTDFIVGSKSQQQSELTSVNGSSDQLLSDASGEPTIKSECDSRNQDVDMEVEFATQMSRSRSPGTTKVVPEPPPAPRLSPRVSSDVRMVTEPEENRRKRKTDDDGDDFACKTAAKKSKELMTKRWNPSLIKQETISSPTDKDLKELMDKLSPAIRTKARLEDTRKCVLCHEVGDAGNNGPGRLVIMDADKWVHLNCALWSYEVYETMNGALVNVDQAYKRGLTLECVVCHKNGATLSCFKQRCTNLYHVHCAQTDGAVFFQDKTIMCSIHSPKTDQGNTMTSITVLRRVYVNRDENKQIARVVHLEEKKCVLRIGGLIIHNLGQLLPHQIYSGHFNTADSIYPAGFKSTRYYWSYRQINKRCRYVCKIEDQNGRPEFVVTVIEKGMDQVVLRDSSCKDVWARALVPLEKMRRENDLVKIFPTYLTGEELFGLTEPAVLKIIESLPGVEMLSGYNFRYGKSAIYKLPLAVNPSGCARTEPKLRTHFRKPHTLHVSSNARALPSTVTVMPGDVNSPYLKQFVHSKSQQYRRLKTEWRNNVYLRRSNIQGLGLFAARELEKHTMVIEYIGQLIRSEVAESREKFYEKNNHGVYMFRIDDNCVVDATMSGGPARYVNHSCNPNCVAEVVPFEKDSKIIIFTKRKIAQGEELSYDYKFDFEDDQHKIPCLCGATNCRKWMN